MNEEVSRMRSARTSGYSSASRRKEVPTQAAARINLEDTVLGERARHERPIVCGCTSVKHFELSSSQGWRAEWWERGGGGCREGRGSLAHRYGVSGLQEL